MIRGVETKTEQAPSIGEHSVAVWYLISRCEHNRLDILTVFPRDDEETVPVFGTRRMAEEFLRDGGFEQGWRVRESTAGELISLLLSCLVDLNSVSMDPSPDLAFTGTAPSKRATRREFIAALMGRPLLVPVP
ncbi:MAG TPA: hypothetical protein VFJ72_10410 [Rubrobacteraceae bacterium]|nr:hypothetical protein [Rubrobacteraceae bacterium]